MSRRPPGLLLVLVAALVALALVPGSMSATEGGSTTAAAEADPVGIALDYARTNAAELGVTRADVADLFVTSAYESSASGVTHVNLNQRYQGLEVFGGHATINVARDGRVIFTGGRFVADLAEGASGANEEDSVAAVAAAAEGLDLGDPARVRVLSSSGGAAQKTILSGGTVSDEPIPARLGWQPTEAGLRLAWQLVIDEASESHLWNATVDAATGELLAADDWTDHDEVGDLAGTLARQSLSAASTVYPSSPNPVFDGSSYRVFRLPDESPNDAPRQLVESPADSLASPFGWHDTNGVAGAEFTITRGNNVHAYLDQDDNEQADFGGNPEGGPGLDFDFPVDFTQHAQAYREAVTTNLFYGCNMIHDVLYQYGFNEASGNFPANHYGEGGLGGDYVRCEAADGSGTNNANFSTPSEPTPGTGVPRMQMFLWPGNQFGRQNQVVVNGVGEFGAVWSRFGPPATPAGVSGPIVLVDDGVSTGPVGTVNDGCEPYGPLPAGAIAVVDRANTPPPPPNNQPPVCSFLQQVHNAEAAGAVAVVIANNTGGDGTPPTLSGSMVAAPPTIPAVSVSQNDGAAIKAGLPTSGMVRKHPNHPGIRDGDFDNAIIFHEYGHGVSNRLTGGPAVNCLGGNEQAGEGWSDYYAVTLLMNPVLDDPDTTRGLVPYVLFQPNRQGNGLRPRPYSRNMETIQPFTYDAIKTGGWIGGTSLALPHGLGHGWASVLWDMSWELVDKHGFNPNFYEAWDTGGNNRSLQYVTDGLKLQGCFPGLVVSRAAIVAATEALGGEDTCTVWSAFSRRGFGFSAVQGTTDRNDNTEAYDTAPQCRRGFQSPVTQPYGSLNEVDAGDAVPLRFTADGYRQLDVLASNSPFSRRVNCDDLSVPSRPASDPLAPTKEPPRATQTPGNSRLTVSATGVFNYPWKTLEEWAGTCRELVLTRDDGRQHRAFFRFL